MIPTLLRYLEWESRHITQDEIILSRAGSGFLGAADEMILPPAFRICDEAIYAILTIQYGDPKLGLIDLGYRELVPQRNGTIWRIKEEDRWRNVIIQKITHAND